jgi:hypothetical protein
MIWDERDEGTAVPVTDVCVYEDDRIRGAIMMTNNYIAM